MVNGWQTLPGYRILLVMAFEKVINTQFILLACSIILDPSSQELLRNIMQGSQIGVQDGIEIARMSRTTPSA